MSRFSNGHWRSGRTALEHHVLDELLSGKLDRRSFLRHGSRVGLSMAVMAGALRAMGLEPVGRAQAQAGKAGGTIRVAQITRPARSNLSRSPIRAGSWSFSRPATFW